MNDYFTTGRWTVAPENGDAFVEAWATFAGWASRKTGAGMLVLMRDLDDPERFVSIGEWETIDAIRDMYAHGRGRVVEADPAGCALPGNGGRRGAWRHSNLSLAWKGPAGL